MDGECVDEPTAVTDPKPDTVIVGDVEALLVSVPLPLNVTVAEPEEDSDGDNVPLKDTVAVPEMKAVVETRGECDADGEEVGDTIEDIVKHAEKVVIAEFEPIAESEAVDVKVATADADVETDEVDEREADIVPHDVDEVLGVTSEETVSRPDTDARVEVVEVTDADCVFDASPVTDVVDDTDNDNEPVEQGVAVTVTEGDVIPDEDFADVIDVLGLFDVDELLLVVTERLGDGE